MIIKFNFCSELLITRLESIKNVGAIRDVQDVQDVQGSREEPVNRQRCFALFNQITASPIDN